MSKQRHQPGRPHWRNDLELVRAGRDGTYWQAADGLIVRLASADEAIKPRHEPQAEGPVQRPLALANGDAIAE